jgi:ParB family chromosome partitioning protein
VTHTSAQRQIHINRIHPHPDNPREDLGDLTETIASIARHGLLQPIVVEVHPELPGCYQILAGHRRHAAAKKVRRPDGSRLDMVPVVIRTGDSGVAAEELMLVENCHRRDLGPMEKATAMGRLRDRGYSNVRIAKSIGMTDATVGFYLALLDLAPAAQAQVRAGELSAADAVGAVRRIRAKQRKRDGKPSVGPVWEPDHFTVSHPLARKAAALCDGREHSARRRVGRSGACGECWETVIRQDERVVAEALRKVSEAPLALPAG